jgi:hypothetical protein
MADNERGVILVDEVSAFQTPSLFAVKTSVLSGKPVNAVKGCLDKASSNIPKWPSSLSTDCKCFGNPKREPGKQKLSQLRAL